MGEKSEKGRGHCKKREKAVAREFIVPSRNYLKGTSGEGTKFEGLKKRTSGKKREASSKKVLIFISKDHRREGGKSVVDEGFFDVAGRGNWQGLSGFE